jgi:hypothetical protein
LGPGEDSIQTSYTRYEALEARRSPGTSSFLLDVPPRSLSATKTLPQHEPLSARRLERRATPIGKIKAAVHRTVANDARPHLIRLLYKWHHSHVSGRRHPWRRSAGSQR